VYDKRRKLLAVLGRAHRLTFRERRLCGRLASLYGMDGSGGPDTIPAMLFFRPSFWDVFLRDAAAGGGPRIRPERIAAVKAKILYPPLPATRIPP
jgi:hypothetical protein